MVSKEQCASPLGEEQDGDHNVTAPDSVVARFCLSHFFQLLFYIRYIVGVSTSKLMGPSPLRVPVNRHYRFLGRRTETDTNLDLMLLCRVVDLSSSSSSDLFLIVFFLGATDRGTRTHLLT